MRTGIDHLNTMTTRLYVQGTASAKALVHRMSSDEEGQGTAEYVAVIVMIAAVIAAVMGNSGTIGDSIRDAITAAFDKVKTTVTGGGGGAPAGAS